VAVSVTVSVVPPPPAVVKVHVLVDANALPATSFTPADPPVIVAVYVVLAARSAVGFSVATLFVYETAAGTVVDPVVNLNVADVIVDGSIASEKFPVTFAETATPVALAVGDVAVTVGAVVSPPPAEAVVKVHVLVDANALPATSFTPAEPPVIVAVYVVLAARSAVGFSVATLFVYDTAAGTVVDPVVNLNVVDVIVDGFIASENVPVTFAETATPVAPSVGFVAVTVGAVVSPPPPPLPGS
jgi:hypothetical protein